MARQWRLRSKLLLGLGLVVGSVGLLVAGTVLGLTSYVGTMNTTDSKVAELSLLDQLKAEINALNSPSNKTNTDPQQLSAALPIDEQKRTKQQLRRIRDSFGRYRERFQDTVRRNRDPDPYQETQLLKDVDVRMAKLEAALSNRYAAEPIAANDGSPPPLAADPTVFLAQMELVSIVDQLRAEIVRDMYQKIDEARKHYKQSMWVVGVATTISLVLLLTLMHLFKGWVFRPLKKLQAGVQRVYAGDFQTPIVLKSGDELEELAAAFNDTTQKLHHIYRDLERQVDERSRQLVRSERLASVGFLAAGVAHEINNPLASIAFCSEALQSRLADYLRQHPRDGEVVVKYLAMIQQEAFRCKGITGKLLEFSRVGERRREPTDLSELIAGVLEIAQHLQNCRGKRIVFQPIERVVAGVNAEDIKSVVLNLVVNALDSMDEGGTLTITLQKRGTQAELVFVDSGCGMSQDVLQNIFEPFYTRSRTGKGTGLGLFISHQIVDQHAGEINAASAGPKHGSTFTVRLPLQPGPAEAVSKDADGTEKGGVLSFHKGAGRFAEPMTENGIGHAAA